MASGWYGLEVGDKVEFNDEEGEIIHLFIGDKNRGVMKITSGPRQGEQTQVICEWCKKLPLKEDNHNVQCNACGEYPYRSKEFKCKWADCEHT